MLKDATNGAVVLAHNAAIRVTNDCQVVKQRVVAMLVGLFVIYLSSHYRSWRDTVRFLFCLVYDTNERGNLFWVSTTEHE